MSCSVRGITNSVVSADKDKTEKLVRKALKTTAVERAEVAYTPMVALTSMVTKAKPTINGKTVHILNIGKNEEGKFTLKYKIGKSPKVIEMTAEEVSSFKTASGFSLDQNGLSLLMSDVEHAFNTDNFEEFALDITNNPQRILDTAEALIEADEYHNDELHNNVLRRQLGLIQNSLVEMMPNLNLHINDAGESNFGAIDVGTSNLYVSKGIGGSKSLMEIYVHELYHAVTHFAIDSKVTSVRKDTARIEQVRDHFLKNTKASDLVTLSGDVITEDQAEKLLDHLSDPKNGLHEFVALAMSNKAVMNKLKSLDVTEKKEKGEQKLFYRLLDAVYGLFGNVTRRLANEPAGDDLQRMVFLVTRLHTAHKKPHEAKRVSAVRNLLSIVTPLERMVVEPLERAAKKDLARKDRNQIKKDQSDLSWYSKLLVRSFYDDEARDILGTSLSLARTSSGWSPFLPEGSIRTSTRDMFEADELLDTVDGLGMKSTTYDQHREFKAINTTKTVLSYFDEHPTEKQEEAMTAVLLDTDISSIYEKYEQDIPWMLHSNAKLSKEIKGLVAELKSKVPSEDLNFYEMQSDLLAAYMVHGKDNIGLLLNADNIAKKLGTSREDLEVSNDVVELVDQLVSLKALKRTSKKTRAVVKELIDTDKKAIDAVVAFQHGMKKDSEEKVFPTISDKMKMIKGYSAQITDPDVDVVFAPVSKEKELYAQGYQKAKVLNKHDLDGNKTPMAMYVNDKAMIQRFHRVGMRMTDKARRGTTITESYTTSSESNATLKAANDIRRIKDRKVSVEEQMFAGSYDPEAVESDGILSPVLNNSGRTKDFRYSMDKIEKTHLLNMDRKMSKVIGRTFASTYDKQVTDSFNHEIMQLVVADADKNYEERMGLSSSKNHKEYIKIHKHSNNDRVKDLWKIIPTDIKSKYPDGFTLRRDLMYSALGYREMSVTDLPMLDGYFKQRPNAYKKAIKHATQFAEKLWQELIKISKIDIIIRTPGVFIGNVVSNFLLMYMHGYSFKEITTLKYQGIKELKAYVDGFNESLQLEAKQAAGLLSKEESRRLNVIQNNLNNSPVKDLVDEGFYTTILEEVEHGEDSGSYFNRMAKKKLKNVPKIFSDGFDLLYITENTKLFKLMEKGIQASDFAARYAQYHLMVEGGADKQKAIKAVRDNFINYTKPNSRFVEWLNQMGFMMFTKYFTRIQRVLRDYGKNHPGKVLLAVLAQDFIVGDLDDVTDQSVLTKDMGNLFYNPVDNLMRVITPSSAEAVDWVINGGK